jgi:hypothetical protein
MILCHTDLLLGKATKQTMGQQQLNTHNIYGLYFGQGVRKKQKLHQPGQFLREHPLDTPCSQKLILTD